MAYDESDYRHDHDGAAENAHLAALLVGRRIVAARRDPPAREEWPSGDRAMMLTLDDGTRVHLTSVGYDSDRLVVEIEPDDQGAA